MFAWHDVWVGWRFFPFLFNRLCCEYTNGVRGKWHRFLGHQSKPSSKSATFRPGQVPRPSSTTEVDRGLEASGRPGLDGGNREVDAVQHSTHSKRAAVSWPIRPTKRRKLLWLHEAGESSSSEEDETSATAGCLRCSRTRFIAPRPGFGPFAAQPGECLHPSQSASSVSTRQQVGLPNVAANLRMSFCKVFMFSTLRDVSQGFSLSMKPSCLGTLSITV
jgi:hypothetical protein